MENSIQQNCLLFLQVASIKMSCIGPNVTILTPPEIIFAVSPSAIDKELPFTVNFEI